VLLVAGSRSAEDFAEDVADAGAAIVAAVVAVVVITTILPKSCRIALDEAISKLLRPSRPYNSVNAGGCSSVRGEHHWTQCSTQLGIPGSEQSERCCCSHCCSHNGHYDRNDHHGVRDSDPRCDSVANLAPGDHGDCDHCAAIDRYCDPALEQ